MNEGSNISDKMNMEQASAGSAGDATLQDVDMMTLEDREELRSLLTHQIELEIALRRRVAKVLEARIQWAEQLKSSLSKGAGSQSLADPTSFKQRALDEFRAIHGPLDLDSHTTHPRGSFTLSPLSDTPEPTPPSSSSTSKQLYLIPPAPEPTPFPPLLLLNCPYPSCPTPHPSTTLQGLLNHARIAHGPSYAFNSHDDFIHSPGATTPLDARLEPERYARVRSEGVQVSLGGVRGLSALFENGVGVGLGLSKETPALAKLLGREVRKGTIRAVGQDEQVDVESIEDEGSQRWKKYGLWAPKRRQKGVNLEEAAADVGENEPIPSLPLSRAETQPTEPVPSSSRFYVKKRVVVSDWSQSLRRSQIQPNGPTHRWMIRIAAPSYSDHITTFLSAVHVSCATVPLLFEGTLTCTGPPFIVSRLGSVPFLARVTLVFADERTKDVSITQWVDLDPMRLGRPVLGAEQIFDVELDRNAQSRPINVSTDIIPNSVLWAEDHGAPGGEVQGEQSGLLLFTTESVSGTAKTEDEIGHMRNTQEETTSGCEITANEDIVKHPHERLIPILARLRSKLPLTLEDSQGGDQSKLAYMCFSTREELLESPHGRRKAVEWQYARTMHKMLTTDYTLYDADLDPELVECLSVAHIHAHLTLENVFPRPDPRVPIVNAEKEVEDSPQALVANNDPPPFSYCGVCGLNVSTHPPTAYLLDIPGFVCSLSKSSSRPICDIGLWTSLRPVRSAIERVNPIHGLITTLGSREPLRGASHLVECAPPQMTLSLHALTAFWRLKTFGYSAKRRNVAADVDSSSVSKTPFPLELLGIDASHVDRTLAPHALLALVAEIFIKRLVREAVRGRFEMLGELARHPGPAVLTTTHISRALMDGRGTEGWLPLMAVARIGMLHTDTL
ncbi:malate dehydrogenase [Ceratobasidium sp. AG-Ba]|nr:malate dehydrogenase [Ceratobasidium sp. AG-Ba]